MSMSNGELIVSSFIKTGDRVLNTNTMQFIRFFLGTPQRMLGTMGLMFFVWCLFNLERVKWFLNALLCVAINQVLPLALIVLLIAYLIRRAWRG